MSRTTMSAAAGRRGRSRTDRGEQQHRLLTTPAPSTSATTPEGDSGTYNLGGNGHCRRPPRGVRGLLRPRGLHADRGWNNSFGYGLDLYLGYNAGSSGTYGLGGGGPGLSTLRRVRGLLRHRNIHAVRWEKQYRHLLSISATTPAAAALTASAAAASCCHRRRVHGLFRHGDLPQLGGTNSISNAPSISATTPAATAPTTSAAGASPLPAN